MFDYSRASQGLIRALEEYEIPIDHIAGKPQHYSSSGTELRLDFQELAWALSLVDFMLAKVILSQVRGVRSNSVAEWATFGECLPM